MMNVYRVSIMRRVSNDTGHEADVPQMSIEVGAADEAAALDEARRIAGHDFVAHMLQPGAYVQVARIPDFHPQTPAAPRRS